MVQELDRDGAQRFHRVRLASQKNCFNPEEVAGQEYCNYLATLIRHAPGPSDPASTQPIHIAVRLSFRNDCIAWPEGLRICRHRSCQRRFASVQIFKKFRTVQREPRPGRYAICASHVLVPEADRQ